MMNLIRKLLGLCEHRWVIIREVQMTSDEALTIPVGTKFVMQCDKCGNIKTKKSY